MTNIFRSKDTISIVSPPIRSGVRKRELQIVVEVVLVCRLISIIVGGYQRRGSQR